MIRRHTPAPRRPNRRERLRAWHRIVVLRPRIVRDEATGGTFRIWLERVERRWSETHRRWLWRLPTPAVCTRGDTSCAPATPCLPCRGDLAI